MGRDILNAIAADPNVSPAFAKAVDPAEGRAPRKGDRGVYTRTDGSTVGFTVRGVEGNLCYAAYDHYPEGESGPFIWRFHDGLNALHDWPGKAEGR